MLGQDLLGQVEREAVGIFQAKGLLAWQHRLAVRLQPLYQCVELDQPAADRAPEALLLVGQRLEDELAPAAQLRVGVAHNIDRDGGGLGQERLEQAERAPLVGRAA